MSHLFISDFLKKVDEQSEHLNDLGNSFARDIKYILSKLNEGNYKSCDETLVKKMHIMQYLSDYAKDIGYTKDNKLYCSTGLGILDKPYNEDPPHFKTKTGYDIWLDIPILLFGFERKASVIKDRNFNVVINTSKFTDFSNRNFHNAVYARTSEDTLILQSGEDLALPFDKVNTTWVNSSGFTSFKCSNKTIICTASFISMPEAVIMGSQQIIGIFLMSLVSSTFIAIFISNTLNKQITFRKRFLRNLKSENIVCFYQPVLNLETNKACGCEVLVRWQDEQGKIVTPDKFLEIIKEESKTALLTELIIENTFKELKELIDIYPDLKVAINIFPIDFKYNIIMRQLKSYRDKYPNLNINLELTEDQLVEAPKIADDINRLRKEGFMVSIDDFGTGYSSLSYFQELKVDYIKIDRSFVKDLEYGTIKSRLIPHILSIANTIDAEIIAEGIETDAQMGYFNSLGIRYIQGYHFSKPLPAEEFIAFIKKSAEI